MTSNNELFEILTWSLVTTIFFQLQELLILEQHWWKEAAPYFQLGY